MDLKLSAKEVASVLQSHIALKGYDADSVIFHWEDNSFTGATIVNAKTADFTTDSILSSIRKD